MEDISFTALFDSVVDARQVTDDLIEGGIPADDIAVATRHSGTETVFGSASSLLPGQGPFSWNTYSSILPTSAGGAYTQAFVTTVPEDEVSSLFEGQGLPSPEADECADVLRRGGAVLIIRPSAPNAAAEHIASILDATSARYFTNPPAGGAQAPPS